MLSGSIQNSKLSNSSISIGGVTFNLGDSISAPELDLTNSTNYQTVNLSGTITNTQLAGSISNDELVSSSITINAQEGLNTGGSVSLGRSLNIGVNVDDSSIEINNDSLKN